MKEAMPRCTAFDCADAAVAYTLYFGPGTGRVPTCRAHSRYIYRCMLCRARVDGPRCYMLRLYALPDPADQAEWGWTLRLCWDCYSSECQHQADNTTLAEAARAKGELETLRALEEYVRSFIGLLHSDPLEIANSKEWLKEAHALDRYGSAALARLDGYRKSVTLELETDAANNTDEAPPTAQE